MAQNILEQFNQLRKQTPHMGLNCVQNENSPYCQYTERSKNCYMTFASYSSEDCIYNHRVFYCSDCVDCTLCYKCELCYDCIDCINCYNCRHSINCENCSDCEYCNFCVGVKNSFACVGLKQREYCIFNEQVEPEEYKARVAELRKLPKNEVLARMDRLLKKTPRNAMYGKNNEKSYGEHIHNCKNTYWGFGSKYLEDCNFCYHCDESKDLLDCSHLGWSERCFQIMSGGNLHNCMFCYSCWQSSDLLYCELMYNSSHCFLCVGMNRAKYCILNQEYTPDEYERRKAEIIAQMKAEGSWGKWFESSYSEVITQGLP